MYLTRYLESHLLELSQTFPVLLLTGARQVGKTTLLQHLSQRPDLRRRYISLDEFKLRAMAARDPGLFLQQFPPPLMIDEIQYAPALLPYIKTEVDRKKVMGAYWLTGFQQLHLMRHISESLAGRVAVVRLLGVSDAEECAVPLTQEPWIPGYTAVRDIQPTLMLTSIFQKIIRGSFPRFLSSPVPPLDAFYGSYAQTYIDRDLRDLVRVASLASFEKFVRLCAARTASLLNLSDLARDSGVSVNTVKEWLGILEASGIVYLLRPYYRNITKRLIKAPKLYFLDTGLACYLTGWRDAETAMRGAFAGQLFETFVVGEILKSYTHRGLESRLFYFRTKEKLEVDILIEKNGVLFPVEIKLASRVCMEDITGIMKLKRLGLALGQGAVIAPVRQAYAFNPDILIMPPSVII